MQTKFATTPDGNAVAEFCDFDPGVDGLYRDDRDGFLICIDNNWNRQSSNVTNVLVESHVDVDSVPQTVTLTDTAKWDGNEIVVRDVTGNASTTDSVLVVAESGSVFGNDKIESAYGALIIRTDGNNWFLNTLTN